MELEAFDAPLSSQGSRTGIISGESGLADREEKSQEGQQHRTTHQRLEELDNADLHSSNIRGKWSRASDDTMLHTKQCELMWSWISHKVETCRDELLCISKKQTWLEVREYKFPRRHAKHPKVCKKVH